MNKKVLVITPINHIDGLVSKLEKHFELTIIPDPEFSEIAPILGNFEVVFTNPNKSKVKLSKQFIDTAANLKVIVTASTGLVHIDTDYANSKRLPIISLTKEYNTINLISSTAEHALALTLAMVRNLYVAVKDVSNGIWDYEKFIGRQMNSMTVGIVGYGRLGKMYARFIEALGSKILVSDPEYDNTTCPFPLVSLEDIFSESDIVALHIHATPENVGLVNKKILDLAKPDLMLINTSRGEVVNEDDMVDFLKNNSDAKLGTDVLCNEQDNKWESKIIELFNSSEGQIIITPHIGGMSREAQEIAYHRVADMLIDWSKSK